MFASLIMAIGMILVIVFFTGKSGSDFRWSQQYYKTLVRRGWHPENAKWEMDRALRQRIADRRSAERQGGK